MPGEGGMVGRACLLERGCWKWHLSVQELERWQTATQIRLETFSAFMNITFFVVLEISVTFSVCNVHIVLFILGKQ